VRQKKKKTENRTSQPPYAKKSFGQNFLVDQNYIERIIAAVNLQPGETVLEIGPGRGALTERLVQTAGRVVAVELDRELIAPLAEKFARYENFQLIEADALKIDFREIANDPGRAANDKLKLVANLPYYISTAILQKLAAQRNVFEEMILMFQREVVERITAAPADSERGFLTVLVETYFETRKLFDVPPNSFRPAPKVWSAVVRLTPKENSGIEDDRLFRELLSAGFRQKRKTIFNNLKNAGGELQKRFETESGLSAILEKAGIESRRRAETLTLEEWKNLVRFSIGL
jgi:16S rRNA (adenine1518-N6/adenine1519-N6)-dimethyltransferase